jgi:hypothetical protein
MTRILFAACDLLILLAASANLFALFVLPKEYSEAIRTLTKKWEGKAK